MTPHTETAERLRLRTFGKNICPQCSVRLFAPDGPNTSTSDAYGTLGRAMRAVMNSRRQSSFQPTSRPSSCSGGRHAQLPNKGNRSGLLAEWRGAAWRSWPRSAAPRRW